MLIVFDCDADAPRVVLSIPRLGVRETHASGLAATFAAADHLWRRGYVEQAYRVLRPLTVEAFIGYLEAA